MDEMFRKLHILAEEKLTYYGITNHLSLIVVVVVFLLYKGAFATASTPSI